MRFTMLSKKVKICDIMIESPSSSLHLLGFAFQKPRNNPLLRLQNSKETPTKSQKSPNPTIPKSKNTRNPKPTPSNPKPSELCFPDGSCRPLTPHQAPEQHPSGSKNLFVLTKIGHLNVFFGGLDSRAQRRPSEG